VGEVQGLLDALPEETRRQVLSKARRRRYARREVIFHEGDPADCLHIVDKGRVAIRITTAMGDTVTLDVIGRGIAVGEMALVPPRAPRSASAVALEPTETLTISTETFDEVCLTHPATVGLLLAILAERNRSLSRRLAEALFLPVETRIARRLVDLDTAPGARGEPRRIPVTQDDVASLAGTTRESANRALKRLEETGVLELRRGSLVVLDHEKLARRAR
jgi:CRP/FNR family transcriptional regulator, cyclic AMP receptor protein